jgi:DNA helicase-2/ATP-dependent DNA helicase PcrA
VSATVPSTLPPELIEAMGGREPTAEQWRAISYPLEPFVLVAGAGSGKTTVMAARVVYLALAALGRIPGVSTAEGVLPGNVLALTFTVKATENLRVRTRGALASLGLEEGEEPEIDNYHGYAARLLQRHGMLIGIEPGMRVLSNAQRNELAGRVFDRIVFTHAKAESQTSLIERTLTLDAQLADHLVSPEEVVTFNEQRLEALAAHRSDRAYSSALERIELARACAIYRDLKREVGALDFSDQIDLALRLVQEHPWVAEQERERFTAVLLDEYQDTNVAQARLMAEIFGDGHPVTAVGDPDQNIYAWRGASLFNLLEFPRQFPRSDGSPSAKLPLYTNFRSGAFILEAADAIIGQLPEAQRPDPDKQLVPWLANGTGHVEIARLVDQEEEAAWVADRVLERHGAGDPWSECAVLCRTSRLFFSLQQAFDERGIPAEFVNLSGLLMLPEVVEVLCYARAVNDPLASVALARILLGPRHRVGFKDLARVAALATIRGKELRERYGDDDGEATPFLFAEALEHLDDVEGLSEEGRGRLEACREELAALRDAARRPVGEFLGEIIRRTGILDELDAHPDRRWAAARTRNLAAFLDQVHAFEPVEGVLTLRSFLEYVDAVERQDKQEWSPVQPSDEDSVKVMTIHVAKGLEFDTVLVPGLAKGILPNPTIQQNPAERGKSLDFELRGDAAILPRYEGNLRQFKDALKEQEIFGERRTLYVALTRARRNLFASGAHWYGETLKAKAPGEFLRELYRWVEESRHGGWDPGGEVDEEHNPLMGYREKYVRDWPGPARPTDVEGSTAPPIHELTGDERATAEAAAAEARQLAVHLVEREGAEEAAGAAPARAPSTLSASGVIEYARCPKRFYWTSVRPLPRFSGPAARIGTEIHAWIERRGTGQGQLVELDEAPDLTTEELAGEPGRIERLRQAFLGSRFADRTPMFAERPFLLRLGEATVQGRIDAVFGEGLEGPWEVVDWKTGKAPAADDELASLQLDLYGLACVEIWGKRPEDLTLTYLYLASGEERSHAMPDPGLIRERVATTLAGVGAGAFAPTPGIQCTYCDFRAFCDVGTAWLAQRDTPQ